MDNQTAIRMELNKIILLLAMQRIQKLISARQKEKKEKDLAKVKLEVTLRYLATGDSLHTLEALYRVGRSTISIFLPEVCEAIYSALKDYIREVCKIVCLFVKLRLKQSLFLSRQITDGDV
ncbi:hypothetical protein EVAR_31727_1 [Eumeta japonica]|uniref:Uncharacterized protein n=1 Tax=Eumeta variegata TaxID=151549 RepID=A0A4C1YSI6_EUMVA|nr:hypothetical protein EVAR_31727_1 [Eumeta japonica]